MSYCLLLRRTTDAGVQHQKETIMAAGEIRIICPNCQHQTYLPVAAAKRDNFYCSKCLEKVPLGQFRFSNNETDNRPPAKPKRSSRTYRR